MPLYGDLKFKDTLTYVTNFQRARGLPRSQYCGLFKAERDGVVFFTSSTTSITSSAAACTASMTTASVSRSSPRAILEMLFYTDFEPDIINCNDGELH